MLLLGLFSILIVALMFFCFYQLFRYKINKSSSITELWTLRDRESPEELLDEALYPLKRSISWLAHLANLSTLSGLLGTVLGIYQAFIELEGAGESTIQIFAAGIHKAMTTTITGLVLAIPALILHYYFKDKFNRLYTRIFHILVRMEERG